MNVIFSLILTWFSDEKFEKHLTSEKERGLSELKVVFMEGSGPGTELLLFIVVCFKFTKILFYKNFNLNCFNIMTNGRPKISKMHVKMN